MGGKLKVVVLEVIVERWGIKDGGATDRLGKMFSWSPECAVGHTPCGLS